MSSIWVYLLGTMDNYIFRNTMILRGNMKEVYFILPLVISIFYKSTQHEYNYVPVCTRF